MKKITLWSTTYLLAMMIHSDTSGILKKIARLEKLKKE
jgi:hypothetical protein